jgi:hypothetical protein
MSRVSHPDVLMSLAANHPLIAACPSIDLREHARRAFTDLVLARSHPATSTSDPPSVGAFQAARSGHGPTVTDLQEAATSLWDAVQSVSSTPTGIGYDVDTKVGTDDTVFCIVGPNTFTRYGSVSLILKRHVLHRPNSFAHFSAATLYYSQSSNFAHMNRPHISLPGPPNTDQRVEFYHSSVQSPGVYGVERLWGDDLAAMSHDMRGRDRTKAALDLWTSIDAHHVIEGHLPSRLAIADALDTVVIAQSDYKALSPSARANLDKLERQGVKVIKARDARQNFATSLQIATRGAPTHGFFCGLAPHTSIQLPVSLSLPSFLRFSTFGLGAFDLCVADGHSAACLRFDAGRADFFSHHSSAAVFSPKETLPATKTLSAVSVSLDTLSFAEYGLAIEPHGPEFKLTLSRLGFQKQCRLPTISMRLRSIEGIRIASAPGRYFSVKELTFSRKPNHLRDHFREYEPWRKPHDDRGAATK